MVNSIVKTNIDKYANAIVDSNFNLHTWEEINSGAEAEELDVTLMSGSWVQVGEDEYCYVIQTGYFEETGYNYFMFPSVETIGAFAESSIVCKSISNNYVILSSPVGADANINIAFFKIKINDDTSEPYKLTTGTSDSLLGSDIPICTMDNTFEQIQQSLGNDGMSIVKLDIHNLGSTGANGPGYLINRINMASINDLVESRLLTIDHNDSAVILIDDGAYRRIYNYVSNYDPTEL